MSIFIAFTLGSMFGVALMCILQINRIDSNRQQPSPDEYQGKGGLDEQQSK